MSQRVGKMLHQTWRRTIVKTIVKLTKAADLVERPHRGHRLQI